MSLKKEMATGAQYAQAGLLIAQSVVEILGNSDFSKVEMQDFLTGSQKQKLPEIAKQVSTQILAIKVAIWERQKEKLTKFWKDNFNYDIAWDTLVFPAQKEGFGILEYIPSFVTEDAVFAKYAELFGEDSCWKYYNSITNAIKTQQSRTDGDRLILHRGGQEPDAEHLNKSYDDFSNDGRTYAIPKEGMIMALRYRVETGKMMDVKGLTRFHGLDSGGYAMFMYRNGHGKWNIHRNNRDYRNTVYGPREISL